MVSRSLLCGVLALAVTAAGQLVPGAESTDPGQVPCADPRGCPDLVVDPDTMRPALHTKNFKPQSCVVQEGMIEAGQRTVLRFTYTTPNFGSGDLIVGNPADHPEWFEFAPCHNHFHFRAYADYRLWTPDQFSQWDALRTANPDAFPGDLLAANPGLSPVFGGKLGFCVVDLILYDATGGPPKYLLCNFQGISTGWADEYDSDLDGQFIDVTDMAHGDYVLEEEVNPERLFVEEDYANNRGWVSVTL